MDKNSKIYLTGHDGMVGSAVENLLREQGYANILTRTIAQLDLTDQKAVDEFFAKEKPDYVIALAAKVGGIQANIDYPADFIYVNLMIETNTVHSAYKHGVKRLLFLGSSCIYPRESPQPMKEEYLLTGSLEPTNEAYAVAKIAGIKLCRYYRQQYGSDFICLMPCNLYGPRDNFHLKDGHVMPSLIRRFHEAGLSGQPEFTVWGTGKPRREFLYVEDLAAAIVYFMNYEDSAALGEFVNVGYGEDVTIAELAQTIARITGYEGRLVFDTSKPDGMFRKLMDTGKAHRLGWKRKFTLEEGIRKTYEWLVENYDSIRK